MPFKVCGVAPMPLDPVQQPGRIAIVDGSIVEDQTPPPATWAGPSGTSDFPFTLPQVLAWFCLLCRASYSPTATIFQTAARRVVPSNAPITFVANAAGLVPGYGVIELPECRIVVVSGTTNLGQWLAQIFLHNLVAVNQRPAPQGDNAEAMDLYNTAANAIYGALTVDANPKPMIAVGHSMGGAVAQLVWRKARLQGAIGGRCLTFASPKPGTAELSQGTGGDSRFHTRLILPGDIVPALPPDLGLAANLVPVALGPFAPSWARYAPLGNLRQVGVGGDLSEVPEPGGLELIGAAIAGAATGTVTPVANHSLQGFYIRLRFAFGSWAVPATSTWTAPGTMADVEQQLAAAML